jgi:nicotinamidase-related amidase
MPLTHTRYHRRPDRDRPAKRHRRHADGAPCREIVARSAQLARAFRERGLPVVLVNVTAPAPGRTDAGPRNFSFPPDWAELVPELEQHPDDYLVSKQRVGAFIGTSLDEILRRRGVTQVFLTGIATSVRCGSNGTQRLRSWLQRVVLVVDAMTDRRRRRTSS